MGHLKNKRAVTVLCSKWGSAPDPSLQEVLKHVSETEVDPALFSRVAVLVLARAGDALSMRHDSGESAEDVAEGYEIKGGHVADALQRIGLLGVESAAFDAANDASADLTKFLIGKVRALRQAQAAAAKLTVLVTWSGIDDRRIEPVDSAIAETTLRTLFEGCVRTKAILYWRPIIAGINNSADHLARARALAAYADATVFTGLFFRDQIREHFRQARVPDLYEEVARRKILPRDIEERILTAFIGQPLFRKTSCGVA